MRPNRWSLSATIVLLSLAVLMRSVALVVAGAVWLTACNGGADLIAPDLTFPPSVDPRPKEPVPVVVPRAHLRPFQVP